MPLPGLFGLFQQLGGQPDPLEQLHQSMLAQGQQQQQPGAVPSAGPPTALPPNAAAGGPAQAPQQQPTPQAYQSQSDFAGWYLKAQQQQNAADMFNRGMANFVAGYAAPSQSAAIRQSGEGMSGTPVASLFDNVMKLQQLQVDQQQRQQMLGSVPEISQRTGLPESVVHGMILQGQIGQLTGAMAPPEGIRTYEWAQRLARQQNPNATQEEINNAAQNILLTGGGGGGDSATRSWRQSKVMWDTNQATKGTPYPWGTGAEDNPTSFEAWQGAQKAQETKQSDDQTEAAGKLPTYVQNLNGARTKISDILGMTGVDDQGHAVLDPTREALLKSVIGNPFAQNYINGEPGVGREWQAWWTGLSAPQKQVLTDIKEATDPSLLIGGLAKRAPKRGEADVTDIGAGFSGMHDVTKGYGHWLQGALNTVGAIDTATANAYGASGQAANAPEGVKDLIDPTYLYGGKLYPKGQQPLPIPQDQLANARDQIQHAANPQEMRLKLITHFRARNFDPTPLNQGP